jgi:phage terminase large subunit-like protein
MPNQVLTIASQTNADSICNFAVIRASTDAGTPTAQTFNFGFVPRRVKVVNLTVITIDEWLEGMAANTSVHTVGATGVTTLNTTDGITVSTTDPTKGMVTLDATTMAASSVFSIVAMG